MTSPTALDRDGEWYLSGVRDTLRDIGRMAERKDTATEAHHTLEAIREYCDVMLAKAEAVEYFAAARVKFTAAPPANAEWVQARLFGDTDVYFGGDDE